MKDTNSLAHTSYRCKYHIVMIPKYRRMVIYGRIRSDIVSILKLLIERKPGVVLIKGEACRDHIHMLLEIPPKYSVSEFMGYLKSKSTLMIFDRHANMKYKYGNRHFWAKGYFVDTVGKNTAAIKEYMAVNYTTDNVVVAVAGNFDEDKFINEINKLQPNVLFVATICVTVMLRLSSKKKREDGTYDELVAKGGVFAELVERQRLDIET